MTHKILFIVTAVILIIFGLIWFFIPNVGLMVYGHDLEGHDLACIITRYWGSAFIALAVILWLARKGQADSIAVRAIIIGGFVLAVTGFIASLIDMIFGTANGMLWLNLLLYGVFAVLYGILAFKKPA